MQFSIGIQLFILLIAPLSTLAAPKSLDDCYDSILEVRMDWTGRHPQFGERCDWPQMKSTLWDTYNHIYSLHYGKEPSPVPNHRNHANQIIQ
ncbi:hypothetical protein FRC03_001823 [Tulasnella sp. 419]|nr:hypothetical protein FRC03_001823 [Tulasnella sp. 419]